ncbi:serine hydrolase, partial [Erythrobacter sp. HI0063]|uniref:serine hydrolase n=1 Tax=Erythrobacter sp. HI0063 TaxID=1822240 RepID=UPI001F465D69
MISISDNTATDTLIRQVGRERVEEFLRRTGHSAPERTLPFLTTREMFLLKTLDVGPTYAAIDQDERRAMLADLGGDDVTTEQVVAALAEPLLVEDIEWFASMEDERRLLRTLIALSAPTLFDILAVSPQLSEKQ